MRIIPDHPEILEIYTQIFLCKTCQLNSFALL